MLVPDWMRKLLSQNVTSVRFRIYCPNEYGTIVSELAGPLSALAELGLELPAEHPLVDGRNFNVACSPNTHVFYRESPAPPVFGAYGTVLENSLLVQLRSILSRDDLKVLESFLDGLFDYRQAKLKRELYKGGVYSALFKVRAAELTRILQALLNDSIRQTADQPWPTIRP